MEFRRHSPSYSTMVISLPLFLKQLWSMGTLNMVLSPNAAAAGSLSAIIGLLFINVVVMIRSLIFGGIAC